MMISLATFLSLTLAVSPTFSFVDDEPAVAAIRTVEPPVVELVICLDTSGSMSGLINAARQKLWVIVNELATAKPSPKLRVALLTFGNDGHDQAEGWVRVDSDFTDDLDLVSERLFALTTNGGTELVGRVIQASLDKLSWSTSSDGMRLLFVAGNESADQDQEVPYAEAVRRAIERSITVSSIYCGPATDDIAPGWKNVALLADGTFASIDQDNGTVVVETPFDAEITQLNEGLNATYLRFGQEGLEAQNRQVAQDVNCKVMNSEAIATRAVWKANGLYNCASWDLVDALKQEGFDWEKLDRKTLPEAVRELSQEELEKHAKELGEKREELQKKILELGKKRDAFVAEKMKEQAGGRDQAFDAAVLGAIRAQGESRGLTFEK
ncbi:MAG: VWA domain-containing protein [Planctomycetota bacterium]